MVFVCRARKPSSTFTGSETAANLNSANANAVTVKAKWNVVQTVWNFDYTGSVQTFTVPQTGYYKLEVWGAQGGYGLAHNGSSTFDNVFKGGYGGYSYGTIYMSLNQVAKIYVGGEGESSGWGVNGRAIYGTNGTLYGGWNGGGDGSWRSGNNMNGGGGGSSDIRISGTQLSNRVIVAGGGGSGGDNYPSNATCGFVNADTGGMGGGYIGETAYKYSGSEYWDSYSGYGSDQGSHGYSNGVGCSAAASGYYGGGGGGYYGGSYCSYCGASGGSGYIGGLISNTRGMYTYRSNREVVDRSSVQDSIKTTYTSSTGHAVANAANTGNGYAKITYLGTSI